MNQWRGTTLIIEKSHTRVRAVFLKHPLTRKTLHSHNSRKEAVRYCRQNGYSWMEAETA